MVHLDVSLYTKSINIVLTELKNRCFNFVPTFFFVRIDMAEELHRISYKEEMHCLHFHV